MSATVTILPAAKANIIEILFLNFKVMNPPRSVDKNVNKANSIAKRFIFKYQFNYIFQANKTLFLKKESLRLMCNGEALN